MNLTATVLKLIMVMSVTMMVIHALFGNPYAAATHLVVGSIAAIFRGRQLR